MTYTLESFKATIATSKTSSSRGIHGTAAQYLDPASGDAQKILPMAVQMLKGGYYTLVTDGGGKPTDTHGDSGYGAAEWLLAHGVVPFIRYFRKPLDTWLDAQAYATQAYVTLFRKYGYQRPIIQTMNEPDLEFDGPKKNFLERSIENFITQCPKIIELGAVPAFPPFAGGVFGHDGETAGVFDPFEVNPLAWVAESGVKDLVGFCHAYPLNHPLTYPDDEVNREGKPLTDEEWNAPAKYIWYGKPITNQQQLEAIRGFAWGNRSKEQINAERWQNKNPAKDLYHDDACWRAVEIFRELAVRAGYDYVPWAITEGGYVMGDGQDGRYPRITPAIQIQGLIDQEKYMVEHPWLLTNCPWLITNDKMGGTGGWADNGWFTDRLNQQYGFQGHISAVDFWVERPLNVVEPPSPPPDEPPIPDEPPDEPGVEIVNDAESYGVSVIGAAGVNDGDWYWKAVKVHHLTPDENRGNHNLFVNVLDRNGERVNGAIVSVQNANGTVSSIVCDKPSNEPMGNCPISKNDTLSVWVPSKGSDRVIGIHSRHPDEAAGNTLYHHSFEVTFKETQKSVTPEPPPSTGTWQITEQSTIKIVMELK